LREFSGFLKAMKKKVFGKKLGRERDSRRALFRSLIRSLVEHGKIKTTKAKAKAVLPSLEKLVNKARTNDVSSRRIIYSFLGNDRRTANMFFGQIAKNFSERKSGFVRITNLPRRKGDNAEIVMMEWTDKIEMDEKKPTGKKVEKETAKGKEKTTLKSRVSKMVKGKSTSKK
jgi:large subunit ribosomal protein L17